jgi:hydrogenase maturation protein HypF
MVDRAIMAIRNSTPVSQVALSGGVWQNITLLHKTTRLLEESGLTVYIHHLVPPNDAGLALGQAAIASANLAGYHPTSLS